MSTSRRTRMLALTLLTCICSQGAHAALVRLSFAGTLDDVSPELAAIFSVGDAISFSFDFETTTPVTSTFPFGAFYSGAISNAAFSAGALSGTNTTGNVQVRDNDPVLNDAVFFATSAGTFTAPPLPRDFEALTLRISDTTQTAFGSTAMPTGIDPADFDMMRITLGFAAGVMLSGDVSLVPTQAVAEPGLAALLAFCVAIIVIRNAVRFRVMSTRSMREIPAR